MESPFTDFVAPARGKYSSPDYGQTFESPLVDPTTEIETGFENFIPSIEGELTKDELHLAMGLNPGYMASLRWVNYLDRIVELLKTKVGINAKDPVSGKIKHDLLAKAVDKYQESKSLKPTNKGSLAIGTWSVLQDDLGFLKIDKPIQIDIEKAKSENKKHEQGLWGSQVNDILRYFTSLGIMKDALPLDAKYFALVVAKWQGLHFKDKRSIDGVLGPNSWKALKPLLIATPAPVQTPSRWLNLIRGSVPCPATPLLHGKETFKRMADAIRTASNSNHYIYILGWMLEVDFEFIPGDKSSTLINLLKDADARGVEIRILIWDSPLYLKTNQNSAGQVNRLKNALMQHDNATFGSEGIKKAVSAVQQIISRVPSFLRRFDVWNDFVEKINVIRNEGSHHEKVLIVKGIEGLVAFCGGIDINSNRISGVDKDGKSSVLHDVHCLVRDHAAWVLLHRFIWRWQKYNETQTWKKLPLRGEGEPVPVTTFPIATTANVKIIQTYNHPTNRIKDRSIRETVKIAIANAQKTIHLEDQYMISLEIAQWLNAKLKEPGFKSVSILTQDDDIARDDILFPKDMRNKFLTHLQNGLTPDVIKQKVFINMLHPDSPPLAHHKVHSKIYIIDDELAILGSANCSSRSMTHDSETAAVIFNIPGSTYDFVGKLNALMNYDPEKNLIKYIPNAKIKDRDVEVTEGIKEFLNNGSFVKKLALKVTNIDDILEFVNNQIPKLKPLLIDIIDPDADNTIPQQEITDTLYETYQVNENGSITDAGRGAMQFYAEGNSKADSFYNEAIAVNSPFLSDETIVEEPEARDNDELTWENESFMEVPDLEDSPESETGILSPASSDPVEAFRKMDLLNKGMSPDCFAAAWSGFRKLDQDNQLKNNRYLTIVDFTQSSKNRRLYLLDLANQQIIIQTNVSHGQNSGTREWATKFSDIPSSHQSSLGFYVTLDTYISGKNGLSLRIEGKEPGFNGNAKSRSIVVHGSKYVHEGGDIIGRSWGCPAVSMDKIEKLVNTIKNGTCLFIYFNDPEYLTKSKLATSKESLQSSPGLLKGIIDKGQDIFTGIVSTFTGSEDIIKRWGSKEEIAKCIEQLTYKELPAFAGKKPEQMSSSDRAKFNEAWTRIRKKLLEQRRVMVTSGTIPPLGGSRVPFGFKEVTYNSIKGLRSDSTYLQCERLDKVLSGMHQQKKIKLTQDQLDVLQRISNVETSGKIQTLNSYDRGVVSIGFMQFTIHVGKIQQWMKLAPDAFKRFGLELDLTEEYDFGENGKHPSIKGIPQTKIDALRWNGWAERFYYAALDEQVIAAEVGLALEYLQNHLKGLKYRLKNDAVYSSFIVNYYQKNNYVRGLFQASYNNNPSRSTTCVRDTFAQFQGGNPSINEFLEKYKTVLRGKGWERLVNETANGASISLTTIQNEEEIDYSGYETNVESFEEEDSMEQYANVQDAFEIETDEEVEEVSYSEPEELYEDEDDQVSYEDLIEVSQESNGENYYEQLMSETVELETAPTTTIPSLLEEDTSVSGYTCYVKIDIGKGNYPLNKTGIYVPTSFNPSEPVDVVIYLHGMTGTFPGPNARINDYWSMTKLPSYDFRLRDEVNASGKNVVLIAPSLGNSPNSYNNYLSGKKYGLDSYMEQVLNAVNTYVVKNRFNAQPISFRNVILSAHSAGGRQMRMIANADNPVYGPKITECWGFDSLYSGVYIWLAWAKKNPGKKVFVYYLGSTESNSRNLSNNSRKLSNVFVKRSTAKNHYLVPKEHLQDRLRKLGRDDLSKTDFEEGSFISQLDFTTELDELVKDPGNAIRLNRQYAGKLGWGQYIQQINSLLLPYSGLTGVSLGEEAFAEAVANWQLNQGFSAKDSDGIIGPNTWAKMKLQILPQAQSTPPEVAGSEAPSTTNIFEFNRWHAQKILESMNDGIIKEKFKSRSQLEKISRGEKVHYVDPNQKIIQILPIIHHIAEQARQENYREIIVGSFIRDTNTYCGHCTGRCIDINHVSSNFETQGSAQMVIRIFTYLLSLPGQYKKDLRFGMPMQGEFFGNKNLNLFKRVEYSELVNEDLKKLARQLNAMVFPDNPNHLHIQVKWDLHESELSEETMETDMKIDNEFDYEQVDEENYAPEFEQYSRSYRLNKVADWAYLLSYKVPDEIVAKLKARNMVVQYAHNESYSNDLNVDFYRLRIDKFPTLNGVQLNPQSLIKYIRLNINNLINTSYSEFHPYDNSIDKPVWNSDDPTGAVIKIDIPGPDNAAVVVSLSKPNGWRFSTIETPNSGSHPVSGHREFFIGKDSVTKGTYFIVKGLDMASKGIAGMGLPVAGRVGFGIAHELWKSIREKIIKFINTNGGSAKSDITYSERVEWRYVYYRYKNLLADTFGKGAGSAENSSFFD